MDIEWDFSLSPSLLACLLLASISAQHTSRGKNPVSYATLSVRGSTMRAWLLPESLNLDALLVDDTASTKKKKQPTAVTGVASAGPRGRGRGRGRR